MTMENILLGAGVLFLVQCSICIFKKLYSAFSTFTGRKNLKSYGSWAIITGSTDGIGKAIAKELAKQHINLILISRNSEKLAAVSKEISEKFNVEVKTEAMDLSNTSPSQYGELYLNFGKLDIGIIVNNVGLSYDHPEYLDTLDTDRLWKMIHMNVMPATALTKEFLGNMVSNKKGLVVNVGSMSGMFETPLLSVYSASKAYVHTLTEALRQEYAELGIHFQVICPMYVATAMSGKRPALMCPTAEGYARSAVATFGKTGFTTGYWAHSLQTTVYGLVPRFILNSNMLKIMKRGRARWYKKQNEKKE